MSFSNAEAKGYLTCLLNKSLRVTTTDMRMFLGEFKCTDSDRNIILSHTYEYRLPSSSSLPSTTNSELATVDMTSRYLGLVVVPGEYITKIELELFASQMKPKKPQWLNPRVEVETTTTSIMAERA